MNSDWRKDVVTFPSIDLQIEAEERGLKIQQCGEAYLAKNWRLTNEVIGIVETAVKFGLTSALQQRHPQAAKRYETGETVEYISFSLSPTDYWVFAVDDQCSPSWKVRDECYRVIFKRAYRAPLRAAGIATEVEWRSPQNIFVARNNLEDALRACEPYFSALSPMKGGRLLKGQVPGFVDEDDLHRALLIHWKSTPMGKIAENVASEVQIPSGRIDLMGTSNGTGDIVIAELKQVADETEVDQLERYLNDPQITGGFDSERGRCLGFLIAEDIKLKARRRAKSSDHLIICLEATWTEDGVVLSDDLALD